MPAASQAESASSILVTRSMMRPQVGGLGFVCCADQFGGDVDRRSGSGCHTYTGLHSEVAEQAADAVLDLVADGTYGVDTLPCGVVQLQSRYVLPGKTRHVSPHPMVITT
ncbi:hypothetical protein AQJ58_37730 [Streptomyces sp. DSM 15324]|nr:hypothetical protein AQJ58_37730 [Streptomyces sp. DSM 15324]